MIDGVPLNHLAHWSSQQCSWVKLALRIRKSPLRRNMHYVLISERISIILRRKDKRRSRICAVIRHSTSIGKNIKYVIQHSPILSFAQLFVLFVISYSSVTYICLESHLREVSIVEHVLTGCISSLILFRLV